MERVVRLAEWNDHSGPDSFSRLRQKLLEFAISPLYTSLGSDRDGGRCTTKKATAVRSCILVVMLPVPSPSGSVHCLSFPVDICFAAKNSESSQWVSGSTESESRRTAICPRASQRISSLGLSTTTQFAAIPRVYFLLSDG